MGVSQSPFCMCLWVFHFDCGGGDDGGWWGRGGPWGGGLVVKGRMNVLMIKI